jgi:hypothetical protein
MMVDDGDRFAKGPRHMWDVGGVLMEEGGGQRIKGRAGRKETRRYR